MIQMREVAVLDRNAEALGVDTATLMANAGAAIAEAVHDRHPDGPVLVLAGPGNNGGDGLVAARHLHEAGRAVTVVKTHAEPKTSLARNALDDLPDAVRVEVAEALDDEELDGLADDAAVVLDSLLGAGASGAPRDEVARLVGLADRCAAPVVSVDVPTGLGTDGAVEPELTVTLHDIKEGMTEANSGEIVVVDIGIPERAATHTGPGEFALYPLPQTDQHKGQGGFVLVVGGGPYTGAPALSAMAAMAMGADLAIVLTPESVWPVIAGFSPNIVARPLQGEVLDLTRPPNRVELNRWLGRVDSVLIGPGLGKSDDVRDSVILGVKHALEEGVPLVLDADALWSLSGDVPDLRGRTVLTPHAKEFQVLTGLGVPDEPDGRAQAALKAAEQVNGTVLLKGPVDVIAEKGRVKYNATGCPAMSVGGTGDVLAGLAAGLLAKRVAPFDAARLAAYTSGRAGEAAYEARSYGMTATDVLEAVPDTLKTHLDNGMD